MKMRSVVAILSAVLVACAMWTAAGQAQPSRTVGDGSFAQLVPNLDRLCRSVQRYNDTELFLYDGPISARIRRLGAFAARIGNLKATTPRALQMRSALLASIAELQDGLRIVAQRPKDPDETTDGLTREQAFQSLPWTAVDRAFRLVNKPNPGFNSCTAIWETPAASAHEYAKTAD